MSTRISDYLRFSNLQIAADTQAQAFIAEGWQVVEHTSCKTTSFSGTLFRNSKTGEQVLSFRSTEFAHEAARDNQATKVMEINAEGWAFAQVSDMRTWVESLYASGKIDGSLAVTGYSLGDHLATNFNRLYPDAVAATYTFNGAGMGTVVVTQAINVFREHEEEIHA